MVVSPTTVTAEELAPAEWSCTLLRVRQETPSVRTFFFTRPDLSWTFRPGQYCVLTLAGVEDPRGSSRTFSLSSAPDDRDALSITTRLGPSPFKTRLFSMKAGDPARLWGTFGSFVMDLERPAVLLGGGIGVTPFRSMVRQLASSGTSRPVVFLCSSRTADELVFGGEMEALADRQPWLRWLPTVTRSGEGTRPWSGRTGHIDAQLVRTLTAALDRPIYYLCGPPTMVGELHRLLLREMRVPEPDTRTELFRGY